MIRLALAALVAVFAAGCTALQDPPESEFDQPKGWTPIQLAFTTDAQLFDTDHAVHGLRLSAISAKNRRVDGIDLGLGKSYSGGGVGIALSLVWTALWDDFYGIQIAGGINTALGVKGSNAEDLNGFQVAILANKATVLNGAQFASVNVAFHSHGIQAGLGNAANHVYGLQTGIWNISMATSGVQLGVINTGGKTQGFQLGLFNSTESGLQVGLINHNDHGFLPWFPLVNF